MNDIPSDKEITAVFESLKYIPHLKLPITFDVTKAREDLVHIDEYIGYRKTIDEDVSTSDVYFNNWKGRGIIDFVEDSRMSMMRSPNRQSRSVTSADGQTTVSLSLDETGKVKFYVTDLGKKTPNIVDIIYALCDNPYKSRVTKILPDGAITWHSHFQNFLGKNTLGGDKDYWHCIVHVPLQTNPGAEMGVTKFSHKIHGVNPIWKHYEVGEAWVFNGWHEHNVRNTGTDDRIHIMCYLPLKDRKFIELLKEAVTLYDGPLIK